MRRRLVPLACALLMLAGCGRSQSDKDAASKDVGDRGFTVTSVYDNGTVYIKLDVSFGNGCVGMVDYDSTPQEIQLIYKVAIPDTDKTQDIQVNDPTVDKLKTLPAFDKCFK